MRGYDTGLRVRHPFDQAGCCRVYVANFILMGYGTGAIFGCPAHDQRDLDFRQEVRSAVIPWCAPPMRRGRRERNLLSKGEAFLGRRPDVNSEFLDGLPVEEAKQAVAARLRSAGWRRAAGRPRRELSPARLGHLAAALLGLPHPDDPLRALRRRPGAPGRPAGHPARRH
jgi:leucyl-tRNA synthetase